MPCFRPLQAFRAPGGQVQVTTRGAWTDRPLQLRCGQCQGCRLERARAWALRCVHEASLHADNCFITLTYRDRDYPVDGSLDVRHWQLFAKRVRKALGPFRFLHCGEYGERTQRAHYHALLFGLDFADRQALRKTRKRVIWTSPTLHNLWRLGDVTVDDFNMQTASYVARYVLKKVGGDEADEKYFDPLTGSVKRAPYITMSRRPGIGHEWLKKFHSDVYPSDEVVHNGRRYRPPRYYDSMLPESTLKEIQERRARRAASYSDDLTTSRLREREASLESKLRAFEKKRI